MNEEANPQTTPEVNVNELFQQRVAKAEALAAAGINPFGKRFDGDRRIAEWRAAYRPDTEEPQPAIVAGRMTAMRVQDALPASDHPL